MEFNGWLYIVATTTQQIIEANIGKKRYQNTSNVLSTYFEEKFANGGRAEDQQLIFKVGYSENGKLYQRINDHRKSFGSEFLCAFKIRNQAKEQEIHQMFKKDKKKLIKYMNENSEKGAKLNGYTELYYLQEFQRLMSKIRKMLKKGDIIKASQEEILNEFRGRVGQKYVKNRIELNLKENNRNKIDQSNDKKTKDPKQQKKPEKLKEPRQRTESNSLSDNKYIQKSLRSELILRQDLICLLFVKNNQ